MSKEIIHVVRVGYVQVRKQIAIILKFGYSCVLFTFGILFWASEERKLVPKQRCIDGLVLLS